MEEKNYQQFEEKENTGIASEPSVAVQNVGVGSYTGAVTIHDEIDDLDWGRCPILGPKTLEEAVARISAMPTSGKENGYGRALEAGKKKEDPEKL